MLSRRTERKLGSNPNTRMTPPKISVQDLHIVRKFHVAKLPFIKVHHILRICNTATCLALQNSKHILQPATRKRQPHNPHLARHNTTQFCRTAFTRVVAGWADRTSKPVRQHLGTCYCKQLHRRRKNCCTLTACHAVGTYHCQLTKQEKV